VKIIYKFFLFLPIILNALIIEPFSIFHISIVNDIKIIDNKIYSVSNDNTLKIWSKNLKLIKLLKHNFNVINKLKFSPNKNILAIAAGSNLYFYNKNFKFLYYRNFYDYNKKYGAIYDVAFLNNHILACVNWDGYIVIYDLKNKKILKTKKTLF